MPPATLLEVKMVVLGTNIADLEKRCKNIIAIEDANQVEPVAATPNHASI